MPSDDGPPGNHGQRPSPLRSFTSFSRQRACSDARRAVSNSSPTRRREAASSVASRTHGVESSAIVLRSSFCSSGLFSVSPPAAFHFSNVSRMRGSELAMNDASAFA